MLTLISTTWNVSKRRSLFNFVLKLGDFRHTANHRFIWTQFKQCIYIKVIIASFSRRRLRWCILLFLNDCLVFYKCAYTRVIYRSDAKLWKIIGESSVHMLNNSCKTFYKKSLLKHTYRWDLF